MRKPPPGSLDLAGRPCVMCGHKLRASRRGVTCRCGARFARFARLAYPGTVRAGGRPRGGVATNGSRAGRA